MEGFDPVSGDIPCICIPFFFFFFGNAFVESDRCIGFGTDFSHYLLGELQVIPEICQSWLSFPGSFWMELAADWGQCQWPLHELGIPALEQQLGKSMMSSPIFLAAAWEIHFPLLFPLFCVFSMAREKIKPGN